MERVLRRNPTMGQFEQPPRQVCSCLVAVGSMLTGNVNVADWSETSWVVPSSMGHSAAKAAWHYREGKPTREPLPRELASKPTRKLSRLSSCCRRPAARTFNVTVGRAGLYHDDSR